MTLIGHGGEVMRLARLGRTKRMVPSAHGAGLALLTICVCWAVTVAFSASATAAVRPPLTSLSQSGFSDPCGVATDSLGDLYVADYVGGEIKVFSPAGAQITEFTPSANAEKPCSLAVDSAGNIYADGWGTDVVKYKPEGAGFPPTPGTTYAPDSSIGSGSGTLVPGAKEATSVAVNPANDHVFVVEEGTHVSEYTEAGTLVSATLGASVAPSHVYYGVDVNGKTGNVYLTDLANSRAYVLNPAGDAIITEIDGTTAPDGEFEFAPFIGLSFLAVDQSNGDVLISDIHAHGVVDEFTEGGEYVTTISTTPAFTDAEPSDIAVDGKSDVFVTSGNGTVYAFGPLPAVRPPLTSLSQSGFSDPCGVATDSLGDLYVADYVGGEIKVFSPAGAQITEFTPSANAEKPCSLAVDSAGNIYADGWGTDVVKYKPEGAGFPPTPGTTYAPDSSIGSGSGTLVPGAKEATSVAVNPANDHVFVVEEGTHVSEYTEAGTLVSATLGASVAPSHVYYGVDVNGKTGNVYLTDLANSRAYVLNPAGDAIITEIDGTTAPDGEFEFAPFIGLSFLAVDQSNGDVLISDIHAHGVVDEFTEGGEYVTTISTTPAFTDAEPSDIAVDGKSDVFVTSGNGTVYAFGPLPAAGVLLTINKTGGSTGTVTSSPAGIDCGSACKAEFEEGVEVTLTPGAGSTVKAWAGCDAVSDELCTVAMTSAREVTVTFAGKPQISGESASQVQDTSARLRAEVNPEGEATGYQFEYLTLATFEANLGASAPPFQGAIKSPASLASAGAGMSPVAVTQQVNGLIPQTAYRFRLVAVNGLGEGNGEAAAFTTHATQSFGLPDGRAYEQASPVAKNGGDVGGNIRSVHAAIQGGGISFESQAGIPGAEGSQEFSTYLALREEGAGQEPRWSTQGLLPNATAGNGAEVQGWTPDFSHVFDSAAFAGVNWALLDRSSHGGALTQVGPYSSPNPGYQLDGSSLEGSKVFFEASSGFDLDPESPAPASEKLNVYAWSREQPGSVRLAGVLPNGAVPPGGSVGGGVGSTGYLRDDRAVSSNGSSFYFTARDPGKFTGQLYVRENATAPETTAKDSEGNCQPSSVLACTVHVNASEKTNGTGLGHRDAAGSRPAAFMGASTDGSIAYFTSTEKLTNDATTGPEPSPPAIARANLADGASADLSFLPTHAEGITVVGSYVYWADPGGGEAAGEGSIGRAKLGPSGPEDVEPNLVPGLFNPRDVAAIDEPSEKHLFWTEARGGQEGEGAIGRAELTGGSPEPDFIEGASGPQGIDVSASNIYWSNATLPVQELSGVFGYVGCASTSGMSGSVNQELAKFATGDIALGQGRIYFSRREPNGGGSVWRTTAPASGCAPTGAEFLGPTAAPLQTPADTKAQSPIALDGTHLYFANPISSVIWRVDLNGTDPVTNPVEFIENGGHPRGLAVDSSNIYWSTNQGELPANAGNDLYRFDSDATVGARLVDLAPDTSSTNGVEVQGVLGVSVDGTLISYVAGGVPNGTVLNSPNENHEEAQFEGCCNLYIWHEDPQTHEESTTFVARLDSQGGSNGDAANWRRAAPDFLGEQRTSRISSDGRTLLFRSERRLTAYDNEGQPELYRYQLGDDGVECVSCDPTERPPSGPATLGRIANPVVTGANAPVPVLSRNLSVSGDRVFFESTDQLVPADVNGEGGCPIVGGEKQNYPSCVDVYEWEASGTGTCNSEAENGGCLFLLSAAGGTEPSLFGDADENGANVFIFTRSRLVSQDGDDLYDAYDVREGGGLASQNETEAEPCEGEECKEASSLSSTVQVPGSTTFSGPGNQAGAHHGKKKRHHHHRKRKHRRGHHGSGNAHGKGRTSR